jgi:hypothetical protein
MFINHLTHTMQKNIIAIIFLFLIVSSVFTSSVLATDSRDGDKFRLQTTEKRVALRKENALKEIDRRVASLRKLIQKINSFRRLTSTQKLNLTAEVNAEIDSLTRLRALIEADTDAVLLAEHKKMIVDNYRIYALFLPKITIIANADKILELADLMKTKTTNTEALAKIAEAKTKAQSAIDKVVPLLPAGYPENKTVLQEARTDLRLARVALNAARPLLKTR